MRLFRNESDFQPVRASMDSVLAPGTHLPDRVFQPGFGHFVVLEGDIIRDWDLFLPMQAFLRRRGEDAFWVVSYDPAPETYFEELVFPGDTFPQDPEIYGAIEFSVRDDPLTYRYEIQSRTGASNDLYLDILPNAYFVGSLSCEWAIVAEWDGKAGVAAFRDRGVAEEFVDAFCGRLWKLDVVANEMRDLYSTDEVNRLFANYGPDAYPVPTSCLMPALRE